jgi:hypothetical protein
MIFATFFSLVIDINSEISKFFETSPLRSLPPSDRYLPFQKRKTLAAPRDRRKKWEK